MAAYNLVRAVMCLAARRANLTPRQLSFSFVQTVVEAALPVLDHAANQEEYQMRLDRMLRYAAQGKLPHRSQRRSYPREVWVGAATFRRARGLSKTRTNESDPIQAGPVAVDSSLLASAAYDVSESVLQLEFRDGAIYRYFDVPPPSTNDLLAADSKGSYFKNDSETVSYIFGSAAE